MSTVILRCLSKRNYNRFFNNVINTHKCTSVRKNSNIITSAISDVEIPNTTIHEFVLQNFSRWPHKTAIECSLTGKKYTFEELRIKTRNFNRALRKKLKLTKGDVVGILLPNIPEYPICALGALQAALKITTINPLYTADEIKRQLVDSNAKVIVTLCALWPVAQAAAKLTNQNIPIIAIKMQESEDLPQGSIDFRQFADTEYDIEDVPSVSSDEIALLPYSSGTTGLPKGVELTHRNIVANLCQINHPEIRLSHETTETFQDIAPGVLPWFHIYGQTVILFNHVYHLCKIVSLPKFTPELYVTTLAKYKPTLLFIVPPIVLFMAGHPSVKKEYLQSVRNITSGAAPLGALDEERLLAKAEKHINILQGYGLTETSPCVCMVSSDRKKKFGIVGSVGEVVSNTTVKLVPADNPKGDALGPNQPGEILVKGPQVTKGYHNKPKETEESFLDGWFRTGDLAYYDDNKMFYITDRLKELIKVKGFQVAPAELEEIIRSHPDVSDAAVIGIPHDKYGEVPRAYIVAKPNVKISSEKLKEYVSDKVASYKQLQGGVAVVESIPKNPTGKIMRRQLKLQYEKENK